MQVNTTRRNFLKSACMGTGLVLSGGYFVDAKASANTLSNTRDFVLSFSHNLQFETANTIDVWQPLAMPHSFQTPYNLKVNGNYTQYKINNADNIPILHAQWDNNTQDKQLNITLNVSSYYTKRELQMPFTYVDNADRYIRTDGEIAKIAHAITNKLDSNLQKTQKLFEWVALNIPSQEGKNISGIRSIKQRNGEEVLRGEDISATSVFVALCRTLNIPALESFGMKIDSGRYNDEISKPQHYTRSVVYVDGKWIPNDVLLAINLLDKDSKMSAIQQKHIIDTAFNEWDNNWILLNFARDVKLGKNNNGLLTTIQHAYGEIDGTKLSSYDTTHFQSVIAV